MKLKNKEIGQQIQEQSFESSMPPGRKPIDPQKKKDINVKVTKETRRKLGDIGKFGEDYGDIVDSLIDFYLVNRDKPGVEERRITKEEAQEAEEQ
jgi:hypothetical protein